MSIAVKTADGWQEVGVGGLKWAKDIESEADLAELDADVVAAQEPDTTLWARCGVGQWRMVCNEAGVPEFPLAEIDQAASTGSSFSTFTWGKATYQMVKATGAGNKIVCKTAGFVDTFLILGGGGGAGGVDGDGSSYPGGGGGSGGEFWRQMYWMEEGTYEVDAIGIGGTGGGPRTSGTRGGQTKVTFPDGVQVTCGGGSSGDGLFQSPSGPSQGANGGTRGGNGGKASAPGQANGPGEAMLPVNTMYVNKQIYGQGEFGGTNTGNGGTRGRSNGAAGVFLITIPTGDYTRDRITEAKEAVKEAVESAVKSKRRAKK